MTRAGGALTSIIGAAAVSTALALAQTVPAPTPPPSKAAAAQSVAAREEAYRANNVGVARLEQYDFPAATAAFRRALAADGTLALARLNLAIALFYAGEQEAARKELESIRAALADRPQVEYVLGLIARGADRADDAIASFARVRALDPTDIGAAINLGQLYLQLRRFDEAIAVLRPAVQAEPYNATAAYGLATALVRSGAAEEGRTAMQTFQTLRESSYAVTFSQAYLEQGRYAEAVASTGAEAGLVNDAVPNVGFAEAPAAFANRDAGDGPGGVTLADLDADGDLDLAVAGAGGLRLFRNARGQFTAIPLEPSLAAGARAVVAGDADNDGDADLLVLRSPGIALLRQDAGSFADATAASNLTAGPGDPRTAAWLDADHDGDLDLLIGSASGDGGSTRLFRNTGNGRFEDVTAAAGLEPARGLLAAVPSDYDNRRDVDLVLLPPDRQPSLFRNMRDGTFKDVAAAVGLAFDGAAGMAALGDVNKDGYVDIFLARAAGPGWLAISDGRGRFTVAAADPATTGTLAAQFVDYDNDGLLDLVALTTAGPRLVRNLGQRWMDVSSRAIAAADTARGANLSLASGDIDADGDVDLIVRSAAGITLLRNDGGNKSRSLRVELTARVSNRSGTGTKIEMRAGSLRQRLETYAATPAPAQADVLFGFGDRPGADVVRVLWPSGILQAEAAAITPKAPPLTGTVRVEELDRKPSSCPFLYTWNGERFEFLTDFLGGGEMGYWLGPGLRNTPDPDEYVRIAGDRLQPKDGRLELRVTNELEEAVFLDRAQLVAVAHPEGTAVYPNEGLKPTAPPFGLFTMRDVTPVAAAEDEHGHDVLDRLARMDRRYPDDFALEALRGYSAEHSLTLTLPAAPASGRRVLLLTGWTDYSFSGDNVAAYQRGLKMTPPMLQVADGRGGWRTVIENIGFPVGRPQTVPVELSGVVPGEATRIRIVTSMRVYWDQAAIGRADPAARPVLTRLEPIGADLRWRGFSAERTPDGREPFTYDYGEVSPLSPWKVLPGRYTRLGDVRELVRRTDDRFVVTRPGDEVALSFDAAALAPLPEGWTRTFLLYASGYSKEMDLNSSSPDQLAPLPFAGMSRYPYSPAEGRRAAAARRAYVERYLTRIVARPLPPLEISHAR